MIKKDKGQADTIRTTFRTATGQVHPFTCSVATTRNKLLAWCTCADADDTLELAARFHALLDRKACSNPWIVLDPHGQANNILGMLNAIGYYESGLSEGSPLLKMCSAETWANAPILISWGNPAVMGVGNITVLNNNTHLQQTVLGHTLSPGQCDTACVSIPLGEVGVLWEVLLQSDPGSNRRANPIPVVLRCPSHPRIYWVMFDWSHSANAVAKKVFEFVEEHELASRQSLGTDAVIERVFKGNRAWIQGSMNSFQEEISRRYAAISSTEETLRERHRELMLSMEKLQEAARMNELLASMQEMVIALPDSVKKTIRISPGGLMLRPAEDIDASVKLALAPPYIHIYSREGTIELRADVTELIIQQAAEGKWNAVLETVDKALRNEKRMVA